MDADTRQALTLIRAAITVLLDQEGQDRQMVAEMADQMLADLLNGADQGINYYIGRYCDVIDSSVDVDEIALEIGRQITLWDTEDRIDAAKAAHSSRIVITSHCGDCGAGFTSDADADAHVCPS